jgi:hypothetical protein
MLLGEKLVEMAPNKISSSDEPTGAEQTEIQVRDQAGGASHTSGIVFTPTIAVQRLIYLTSPSVRGGCGISNSIGGLPSMTIREPLSPHPNFPLRESTGRVATMTRAPARQRQDGTQPWANSLRRGITRCGKGKLQARWDHKTQTCDT